MLTDFLAASGFILTMIFSPGPNNLSGAAMSALYGYRRSLRYLAGIAVGVFLLMLAVAVVSASALRGVPEAALGLRYVGAAYILYLAFSLLRASYRVQTDALPPLTFANGLLFQLLNPKLLVFSLTLFTTVFAPARYSPGELVAAAGLLGLLQFAALTVWAVSGRLVSRLLVRPRAASALNVCLALFLAYTALDLLI